MVNFATSGERSSLRSALRSMLVGGVIGLLVFGGVFAVFWFQANTEFGASLVGEDGFFEWLGAGAFLLAAILQLVLWWRSDVPVGRRLIPFARRNVFYLGLAAVLFFAFAEEISWGQRIFGWETPEGLAAENLQGETNIHNLASLQGLLSMTRLFNAFWLGFCVLIPLTYAAIPFLAALYRRISLPITPYWVGGLFVAHFVAWRLYHAFQPVDPLAFGGEIQEAFLGVCWAVLGVAMLRDIRVGEDPEPAPAPAVASRT